MAIIRILAAIAKRNCILFENVDLIIVCFINGRYVGFKIASLQQLLVLLRNNFLEFAYNV